jgi:hypothetical protein
MGFRLNSNDLLILLFNISLGIIYFGIREKERIHLFSRGNIKLLNKHVYLLMTTTLKI